MTKQTLNKYITNDFTLLEPIDTRSDQNYFESHELSKMLEIPLPFISRVNSCCIPDTFAYLYFLSKHSNKNSLSISYRWFYRRNELSKLLREKIISWLADHENYMLPDDIPITALKNTPETWQEMCTSYKLRSTWMEAPCFVAVAEIFRREIYVVLLNRLGNNVLLFKPQFISSKSKPSPFIVGRWNNRVFLPLLKKRNNMRLLGTMVTQHLRQFIEEPQNVANQNFILTVAQRTNKAYKTIVVNNQPINFNGTIIDVKLTWIHSTAPHMVQKALSDVLLLDWNTAYEYYQLVTTEANTCTKLLLDYVYKPLLKKSEDVLDDTEDQQNTISNRIEKEEQEQGAQDYYDEYLRHESDDDENEIIDESIDDDQSEESDDNRVRKNSYSLDTFEDDSRSVTDTKEQIESIVNKLNDVKDSSDLLTSSDLSEILRSIDYTTRKTSEHAIRISKYPDDDDLCEDQLNEDSTDDSEDVLDAVVEENPSLDEIIRAVNHIEEIIKQKISKINKRLETYREYMRLKQEKLLNQEYKPKVLHINEFVLRYKNAKRCPSVYFIYAGYQLVYIGLTTSVSSRFASGHAAFTKLLNPYYCSQPLRICFFALDINGSAIEHSRSHNPSVKPPATTSSNSQRRLKTYEEVLLDCIEQLLINHFKPTFNTQGVEKLHGVNNCMDLLKQITIQIPVIFLSPYPELIKDGIQDIVTITAN